MSIRIEKSQFWKDKNKNCLFLGGPGTGKTALVQDTLKNFGLTDANVAQWTVYNNDFVGCPVETAEFLVFDDMNDAQAFRAVNEILSLRRWKGKAVSPKAVIWACHTAKFDAEGDLITPECVENDKFDVVIEFPYRPNLPYFTGKYGKVVAEMAIGWWDGLPPEERQKVSPRRLDMALQMWTDKGDIRDALPVTCGCHNLMMMLSISPAQEKLQALHTLHDPEVARRWLTEDNHYLTVRDSLMRQKYREFFLPLLTKSQLRAILGDDKEVLSFICSGVQQVPVFKEVVNEILTENREKKLIMAIRRMLTDPASGMLPAN